MRDKPPVSSVAPNRPPIAERGWAGCEKGKPRVPKKEIRSGARIELAVLRSKIDRCQLNSHPFYAAFSGTDRE